MPPTPSGDSSMHEPRRVPFSASAFHSLITTSAPLRTYLTCACRLAPAFDGLYHRIEDLHATGHLRLYVLLDCLDRLDEQADRLTDQHGEGRRIADHHTNNRGGN